MARARRPHKEKKLLKVVSPTIQSFIFHHHHFFLPIMWYPRIDNKFICCFIDHLSNKIKGDYCHCNFTTTIFHPLSKRIKPTHDKGWKIGFGKKHTNVDHEPNHMAKPYNGTFACCLFIIRKACTSQKKLLQFHQFCWCLTF